MALVLWAVTAGCGVALLSAGNSARRRAARQAEPVTPAAAGVAPAAAAPVRYAAVPLTAEGKPPKVPRTKVTAPPGEHPFLQFSHPALAVVGLACWFLFTFIHYRPLAWISAGVLAVTIAAGLSWLAGNTRAARHRPDSAPDYPPRLALLHGLAAAAAITLTVITAVVVSRG